MYSKGTMDVDNDALLSAQVLLRSASGKAIKGETLITAETVHEYTPSAQTVARAKATLEKLGFEVGGMVGVSLSITAPAHTFREVFGVALRQVDTGGIEVMEADALREEIPRQRWPRGLAKLATAITFVPPPEFGPTGFFDM